MNKYLRLLRVKHWIKNLFLFAAPFFGGQLFYGKTFEFMVPVFLSFSLGASSVYIFNDINDIERDKVHPKKKMRPIASGTVSKKSAIMIAIILAISAFSMSYYISVKYLFSLLFYVLIQIAYTMFLKDIPIVDIFCVSFGFIIRVISGGIAFNVVVSHWLLMTMFMISLVLATGKRIGEVTLLNESAEEHRKTFISYSRSTLNEILTISSASALISYALYTVEQFQNMVYTIPVVTFGLFRYLQVAKEGKGDPTEALTKDVVLASCVLLWILSIAIIRYKLK